MAAKAKTKTKAKQISKTIKPTAKPRAVQGAKPRVPEDAKPKLLLGGNPQIPKGYGDAPVQAFIAAMPGWKQNVGRRIDEIVTATVPNVQKAVKWNSPLYGMDGETWFLSFHCMTKYIKVAFLHGATLKPVPPVASKHADVRYFHIAEGDAIDEKQLKAWIKQASRQPGQKM